MHHALAAVGKSIKNAVFSTQQEKKPSFVKKQRFIPVFTDLDQLSNSVVDLIKQKKLDEAEAVSRRLLAEYPDQIDGFNRLAMVYEARGEKEKAAEYYRKAQHFAMSNEGFDQNTIRWFLSQANRLESQK